MLLENKTDKTYKGIEKHVLQDKIYLFDFITASNIKQKFIVTKKRKNTQPNVMGYYLKMSSFIQSQFYHNLFNKVKFKFMQRKFK